MSTRIKLTVVKGSHEGEELTWVGQTRITIGRSKECTFQLHGAVDDLLVSRRHCLIDVHPDKVEIRDLKSCNGTFVNGLRLGESHKPIRGPSALKRRLKNGDAIRIGNAVLQVDIEKGAGDTARVDVTELASEHWAEA